ncbi:MAG: hypothetical protein M1820_005045 [Bogoriella megaspora]|nr:MAG: hypothetical protein M1820_005045 [Bogoriella megaspora]
MATQEPTVEEAVKLFEAIENRFPSQTVGKEKWYILTVGKIAALTGAGLPQFCADLYKYLIAKPEFTASESRQALIRRIRETLVKLTIIVGAPRCLEAIFKIGDIERPEDKDYTFTREGWQCDEANHQRGLAWLDKIYKQNRTSTVSKFDAHKDMAWTSIDITYGLFLSDRQVLDDIDTEMTVVTGIMIQNLPRESAWHLRGIRRLGVSQQDVETLQQCVGMVASFAGVSLHRVPPVADIEHEV